MNEVISEPCVCDDNSLAWGWCAERGRGLETVGGLSLPAKSSSGPVRAALPYVVRRTRIFVCYLVNAGNLKSGGKLYTSQI